MRTYYYERGYDTDAYDTWCDHLIVKDLMNDAVVGTYRLLRGNVATRQLGFYSENEFDLHMAARYQQHYSAEEQ